MTTKDEIIIAIKDDANPSKHFNTLFSFYRKSPQSNQAFVHALNRKGFSKLNLDRLIYETKKVYRISDIDVHNGPDKVKTVIIAGPVLNAELGNGNTETTETDPTDPAEDTDVPKLREDYPFLKEEGLLDEFKILVNDKITAYNVVKEGRQALAADDDEQKLTKEEREALATKIKEAEELNDLIHREFFHFQEKKEVLGEHPIFAERMLQKKVDAMTGEEKAKRLETLKRMIKRDQNSLKKAKTEPTKEKYKALIAEKELELQMVKKALA